MYSTFSSQKDATWHIYVTPGLVGTPAALPYLAQELLKKPLKILYLTKQPAIQPTRCRRRRRSSLSPTSAALVSTTFSFRSRTRAHPSAWREK